MAYTISTYALTSLANIKGYLGISGTDDDDLLTRLINSSTFAIEAYCNRKFKSRAYTMERQDGNGQGIFYVKNYPIVSIERIATSTAGALQVQCTDTDAYSATVSIIRSADPLPANTAMRLSIHGGTNDGDTDLAFSTYTTLTTLTAQINATTGWSATVIGDYGKWASTELITIGASEALSIKTLEVPDTRLDTYSYDERDGSVRWSTVEGYRNIYIDYNGGYATIPEDLEQICIEVVSDVFGSRGTNSNLKSEKIGDYSYTLGEVKTAVSNKADQLSVWRQLVY